MRQTGMPWIAAAAFVTAVASACGARRRTPVAEDPGATGVGGAMAVVTDARRESLMRTTRTCPLRARVDHTRNVDGPRSATGIQVAVSSDGTLLRGTSVAGSLPTISLPVSPGGAHVSGATLQVVHLLAAAPYQLLAKVSQASDGSAHGLEAQLRNGPNLYFGSDGDLGAKWAAAAAVLADAGSAGADYIDVTVASRPAAGAGSDTASGSSSADSQDGANGTSGAAGSTASTGSPSSG